jgi:hypothetical protein
MRESSTRDGNLERRNMPTDGIVRRYTASEFGSSADNRLAVAVANEVGGLLGVNTCTVGTAAVDSSWVIPNAVTIVVETLAVVRSGIVRGVTAPLVSVVCRGLLVMSGDIVAANDRSVKPLRIVCVDRGC